MQEFLVVVAIALVIFFLPRLRGKNPASGPKETNVVGVLTGWIRLSILLTVFWVAGLAAFLRPWEDNTILFFYSGLGPVAAFWGAVWVWLGYKKYRR